MLNPELLPIKITGVDVSQLASGDTLITDNAVCILGVMQQNSSYHFIEGLPSGISLRIVVQSGKNNLYINKGTTSYTYNLRICYVERLS